MVARSGKPIHCSPLFDVGSFVSCKSFRTWSRSFVCPFRCSCHCITFNSGGTSLALRGGLRILSPLISGAHCCKYLVNKSSLLSPIRLGVTAKYLGRRVKKACTCAGLELPLANPKTPLWLLLKWLCIVSTVMQQ